GPRLLADLLEGMKITTLPLFGFRSAKKLRCFPLISGQCALPLAMCHYRSGIHLILRRCLPVSKIACSVSWLQFRSYYVERVVLARERAVPHAASKRRNVHLALIVRIRNHAITPLEVKTRNPLPMFASIRRTPSRRFKARSIQDLGVTRINRHVIHMA